LAHEHDPVLDIPGFSVLTAALLWVLGPFFRHNRGSSRGTYEKSYYLGESVVAAHRVTRTVITKFRRIRKSHLENTDCWFIEL